MCCLQSHHLFSVAGTFARIAYRRFDFLIYRRRVRRPMKAKNEIGWRISLPNCAFAFAFVSAAVYDASFSARLVTISRV